MADNSRLVYSTEAGRTCEKCGWPRASCLCRERTATQPVPGRIVAKLRKETSGRGGKTVTVIDNLPQNPSFLKELAGELKRACGVGGAVRDAAVELQGDQRERVRELLVAKGFAVKG